MNSAQNPPREAEMHFSKKRKKEKRKKKKKRKAQTQTRNLSTVSKWVPRHKENKNKDLLKLHCSIHLEKHCKWYLG